MDVKNFTQFVGLLTSTQTINKHPSFDKLMMCMMLYNSICACGGKSNKDKSNKYSECNRIYREAIGAVGNIKAHLFQQTNDNTISFYVDGIHLIKTLVR